MHDIKIQFVIVCIHILSIRFLLYSRSFFPEFYFYKELWCVWSFFRSNVAPLHFFNTRSVKYRRGCFHLRGRSNGCRRNAESAQPPTSYHSRINYHDKFQFIVTFLSSETFISITFISSSSYVVILNNNTVLSCHDSAWLQRFQGIFLSRTCRPVVFEDTKLHVR